MYGGSNSTSVKMKTSNWGDCTCMIVCVAKKTLSSSISKNLTRALYTFPRKDDITSRPLSFRAWRMRAVAPGCCCRRSAGG